MFEIKDDDEINITRGDSGYALVDMVFKDGTEYVPEEGDVVRFAMNKDYKHTDTEPLILIDIPTDTKLLHIEPYHTKSLAYGKYVYDIELTRENGDVDTFVCKKVFRITEEVH